MTAPRLEIDLENPSPIHHNASTLVKRLKLCGISVTGVTKATLGSPEIAGVLLQAGVRAIGDSRIENIEPRLPDAAWCGDIGANDTDPLSDDESGRTGRGACRCQF